jgi:hypothetical protein
MRRLGRIDLIALPMVPVKMRVDHLPDGLLSNALDFSVERLCRRWLGVGVHYDHSVIGQNHRGVGIHLVARRGNRRIDAIGHLCEFEEIFLGRLGVSRKDTTGVEMIERLDRRRCRANAR